MPSSFLFLFACYSSCALFQPTRPQLFRPPSPRPLSCQISRLVREREVQEPVGVHVTNVACVRCHKFDVDVVALTTRRLINKADTWGSKEDDDDKARYTCRHCAYTWTAAATHF